MAEGEHTDSDQPRATHTFRMGRRILRTRYDCDYVPQWRYSDSITSLGR